MVKKKYIAPHLIAVTLGIAGDLLEEQGVTVRTSQYEQDGEKVKGETIWGEDETLSTSTGTGSKSIWDEQW